MAPRGRGRLPDLCVIALIQQMPLNDQLKVGRVNQRWTALLRAANRRVRSLKILCVNENPENENFKFFKLQINSLALGETSSMQMLKNEDGKAIYPITNSTSKFNCLIIKNDSEIKMQEIVHAFSAIIELTFAALRAIDFEFLVRMLKHNPHWSRQLTSFTLIDNYVKINGPPAQLNDRLFAAINTDMPSLQRLSIRLNGYGLKMVDDLPIIKQLKYLSAQCVYGNLAPLIPSLNRYVSDAADIQIILSSKTMPRVNQLSKEVCDRIVIFPLDTFFYPQALLLATCNAFANLTSISLESNAQLLGQHFDALAQLKRLVHLNLNVDMLNNDNNDWSIHPLAELPSVRSLDLGLTIYNHDHIGWLNLNRIMPNLEFIHLKFLSSNSFATYPNFFDIEELEKCSDKLQCLCIFLEQICLSGFPLNRIYLNQFTYLTAEDVYNISK